MSRSRRTVCLQSAVSLTREPQLAYVSLALRSWPLVHGRLSMRPGSRPRQQLSLPEPSRSVGQAIAGALPIVLVLILLPPLAFASPPDPSWVAGIYDGADADEIVRLVYET